MATTVISTIQFQVGCLLDTGAQQVIIAELDEEKNCNRDCFAPGKPVYIKVYSNVDYDVFLNRGSHVAANDIPENIEEVVSFNNFEANTTRPIDDNFRIEWIGEALGEIEYVTGGTLLTVRGKERDSCAGGPLGQALAYPILPLPDGAGGFIYYGRNFATSIPEMSSLGGIKVGGVIQIIQSKADVYDRPVLAPGATGAKTISDYGFALGIVRYQTFFDRIRVKSSTPGQILVLFMHSQLSNERGEGDDKYRINETVFTTIQFEISEECDVGESKVVTIKARDFITKEYLPNADIWVDGEYKGKTDDTGAINLGLLASGNHTLKISKDGYAPSDEDGLANDNFSV